VFFDLFVETHGHSGPGLFCRLRVKAIFTVITYNDTAVVIAYLTV